jgi:hypothetical protein
MSLACLTHLRDSFYTRWHILSLRRGVRHPQAPHAYLDIDVGTSLEALPSQYPGMCFIEGDLLAYSLQLGRNAELAVVHWPTGTVKAVCKVANVSDLG